MSAYETFASVYDLFMEQVEYDEWLDHIHAVWKKYGITPKTILDRQYSASSGAGGLRCDWR